MSNDTMPLSDEERAELEQLRAEKAMREEQERARRERAELEQLRAQKNGQQQQVSSAQDRDEAARIHEARERGRKLMEPDDDLSMPLGQKVVLMVVAIIVIVIIATVAFGPK